MSEDDGSGARRERKCTNLFWKFQSRRRRRACSVLSLVCAFCAGFKWAQVPHSVSSCCTSAGVRDVVERTVFSARALYGASSVHLSGFHFACRSAVVPVRDRLLATPLAQALSVRASKTLLRKEASRAGAKRQLEAGKSKKKARGWLEQKGKERCSY